MMKTEILIEKEWKYFFNLIGNEILVQFNQKTKEAEFVLPTIYAVFGNNKEVYKIKTENGDLVVSEKRKVYAAVSQATAIKLSSLISHVLPFISSENLAINSSSSGSSFETVGGCTLMTTIAGNFDGENNAEFRKSLSLDKIALPSSQAIKYKCEFRTPFSVYFTSMPLFNSDLTSLASISSSERNLSADVNKLLTGQALSSVMQGCLDVLFGQGRISGKNLSGICSAFHHFQDRVNHNSGAFESGLAMADFRICDNILIDFCSHMPGNASQLYKYYGDFAVKTPKKEYNLITVTEACDLISSGKDCVLSLPNRSADFGLMSLSQQDDTTDNSPSPILVRNDGNYIADLLNISANQSLWNSSLGGLGTSYMQIKAANVSTEPNSFNFSASITDWVNLTSYNQSIIKQLNYQDTSDEAEIEVNLNVPADEPAGTKRTYITFYWESSP